MTPAERAYYDRRASEYDDWYNGSGLYATRDRPGWHEEVQEIRAIVRAVEAASILDVAVGTGYLTREFRAPVTAVDQSSKMLRIARARLPGAGVVRANALQLPFRTGSFDVLFSGHFYGHLNAADRGSFLEEARRVAVRMLLIDAALRADVEPEELQHRTLNDGSQHTVFKRYFTPAQLQAELGGGRVLHAGRWFVATLTEL